MKYRSATLALAVALVLPVAGGTVASAATLTHSAAGKSDHGKKVKEKARTVVYAGTVTAVDVQAATLTLTVHGGRDKKVRNTSLTLTVPDSVKVIRNGQNATLAAIQTGDRVNVQTRQTTQAVTVTRVVAKAVDSTPETEPTTPATPGTDPTPDPSATA